MSEAKPLQQLSFLNISSLLKRSVKFFLMFDMNILPHLDLTAGDAVEEEVMASECPGQGELVVASGRKAEAGNRGKMRRKNSDCVASDDKTEWPELIGWNGDDAVDIIVEENEKVDAYVLQEEFCLILSFSSCYIVLVWVDENNKVSKVPEISDTCLARGRSCKRVKFI